MREVPARRRLTEEHHILLEAIIAIDNRHMGMVWASEPNSPNLSWCIPNGTFLRAAEETLKKQLQAIFD